MGQSELKALFYLLDTPKSADLGHGPRPGVDSKAAIDSKLQGIFRQLNIAPAHHDLIRALVLLWHDHHDEAHNIVQNVASADGSFIHGIVHRREPDYWNSKYWFRRVGKHPAFARIAEQASALLQESKSPLVVQLLPGGRWDPIGFIDACENASQKSADDHEVSLLRELQKVESQCLLEYLRS